MKINFAAASDLAGYACLATCPRRPTPTPSKCAFSTLPAAVGPAFAQAKRLRSCCKRLGSQPWSLEAYVDERLIAEDLKTGKCDAAAISTLRGQPVQQVRGQY